MLTLAAMGSTESRESQDLGGHSLYKDNALENWSKIEGSIKGKKVCMSALGRSSSTLARPKREVSMRPRGSLVDTLLHPQCCCQRFSF